MSSHKTCVLMCQVPEKFSKFPDWGLEGYVAHKDFGSCLFLSNLLLLAWHLSFPGKRRQHFITPWPVTGVWIWPHNEASSPLGYERLLVKLFIVNLFKENF